ncbi:hypothetical protein [Glycomyces dulcitolivorans]|nr:hypothetical protein [Glycomyces dulcitolivorans]
MLWIFYDLGRGHEYALLAADLENVLRALGDHVVNAGIAIAFAMCLN